MRLKDKLFLMQNDQPYLNPIGVHIPEFEKLWDADKTVEKQQYAKEVAYIYHMHEYESPYYDRKTKEADIIKDIFAGVRWRNPVRVQKALAKYKDMDNCAERRALDAAIATADNLADDLAQVKQESSNLEDLLKEIDDTIKNAESVYDKMELMKEKLAIQESKMKIAKMAIDIMPRLEKTIETIINLRKKVTTSVFKGENSDAMMGDFLYDKLMSEIAFEQNSLKMQEQIQEVQDREFWESEEGTKSLEDSFKELDELDNDE